MNENDGEEFVHPTMDFQRKEIPQVDHNSDIVVFFQGGEVDLSLTSVLCGLEFATEGRIVFEMYDKIPLSTSEPPGLGQTDGHKFARPTGQTLHRKKKIVHVWAGVNSLQKRERTFVHSGLGGYRHGTVLSCDTERAAT